MRTTSLTLQNLRRAGFVPLVTEETGDITLGLIGRFWTLAGGVIRFEPGDFSKFDEPGYAKATWSFSVEESSDPVQTRLVTETRVQCTDESSRRRFLRYWTLVGLFSGLIRRETLRLVKRSAEAPGELNP